MKALIINSVCGIKSTGRIAVSIAENFIKNGDEAVVAYGRENVPKCYEKISHRITGNLEVNINALRTRINDNDGFTAEHSTAKFLEWANDYDPDILWLHNLHGYYINVEMLFRWIKRRPQMRVNWTLHDCWAFTGHCSYYTYAKCNKWMDHCYECKQKKEYPMSYFKDASYSNFLKKKSLFTGVENMKIITPSNWLANEVKRSFLNQYHVEVVNNEIDTSVFKPTPSAIRKRFEVEEKKIVLGVAAQWQKAKGWDDFMKLASMLDDSYVIVLVGVTSKQKKKLPSNIIGIERTQSKKELAEIYTAADVFVNPTYEDNYPTTNLEAQACGTPCITYRAGGSVESVPSENVIEVGNVQKLWLRIREMV